MRDLLSTVLVFLIGLRFGSVKFRRWVVIVDVVLEDRDVLVLEEEVVVVLAVRG